MRHIAFVTLSRLQLAVGPAATIIEELDPDGPRRIFSARAPHEPDDGEPSRLLVLHPPPPQGPHSGALLDRMASIRAVSHESLVSPMATGSFEGAAWVVEPFPRGRGAAGGLDWTPTDAAQLLRDAARALVALHRRGLHHGAIVPESLRIQGDRAMLHHLGRSTGGNVADDLYRLGAIVSSSLDRRERAAYRASMPALHDVLMRMTDPDRSRRPGSAEEVLALLDAVPGRESPGGTLVEGNATGTRATAGTRNLLLTLAAVLVMMIAWWLLRTRS